VCVLRSSSGGKGISAKCAAVNDDGEVTGDGKVGPPENDAAWRVCSDDDDNVDEDEITGEDPDVEAR
jgi:hypothetical protein